jgi:nucleoside diphosphate kinase
MRSLKVKAVSENRVTIGFVDPQADAIAHYNNRREKQFGVSPKDRMALGKIVMAVLRQARIVRVKRAA